MSVTLMDAPWCHFDKARKHCQVKVNENKFGNSMNKIMFI